MNTPSWWTNAAVAAAFAGVLVVAVAGKQEAAARAKDASATAAVDRLFAQWNRPDSPGCGVGISRNGTLVYERGYGMANVELGVPITPRTVFAAGSISKQFTAMAILLLAERGELALDDDVRKFIGELPDYGSRITVRHLLSHTSGLRNGFQLLKLSGWTDEDLKTRDDVLRVLALQKAPNSPPGNEYLYNNSAYILLATIIERLSGMSLSRFAAANIFRPLGLTESHFRDDPAVIIPNRAAGYYIGARGDGRGFPGNVMAPSDLQDLRAGTDPATPVGAGGLYTTVRDLLRWQKNFTEARVGTPAHIADMEAPTRLTAGGTSNYGYGLQLGSYRGVREVGHGGSSVGWDLRASRYPDQRLSIVVLCNLENISSSDLTRRVADIYLEGSFPSSAVPRPAVAVVAVSVSPEDMAAKEGLYWSPVTDEWRRVIVRDGALRLFGGPRDVDNSALLTPLGGDRFRLAQAPNIFQFLPPVNGSAQTIRIVDEGGRALVMLQRTTPFTPSSEDLGAFAGAYTSAELEVTYTLSTRDSRLWVQPSRGPDYLLRPTVEDVFEDDRTGPRFRRSAGLMYDIGPRIRFTRDARGDVTGFVVRTSQVRDLRFERIRR